MASVVSIILLLIVAQISDGCLPEPYRRQNRARSFSSTTRTNEIGKIFTLNHGEVSAVRPNLSTRRGQTIYGRLTVPWSSEQDWTLEVMAHWTGPYRTSPLWLYIKRDGLPSTSDFDKTGVSFVSRQYARIRVDEAQPGPYFVMVEAMQDIRNVTLEVNIVGSNDRSSHQEESVRSSHKYWPRYHSVP